MAAMIEDLRPTLFVGIFVLGMIAGGLLVGGCRNVIDFGSLLLGVMIGTAFGAMLHYRSTGAGAGSRRADTWYDEKDDRNNFG